MDTGKVLLGVLAGLATGALLGILFAPAKGSDTRKKITRKGENLVDGIKEKLDDILEEASDKFEKAKEEMNDFTDEAQAKAGEFKESMKAAWKKAEEKKA